MQSSTGIRCVMVDTTVFVCCNACLIPLVHSQESVQGPVEGVLLIIVNWRRCISLCHVYFCVVVWKYVQMWAVLINGWCDVVKTFECLLTKRGHGKVDFAVVIVPADIDFQGNLFHCCPQRHDNIILGHQ
jgi:hypothetical protein